MIAHRLINWLAAILIALAMSMSYLLDGPSEAQARIDSARAQIDAEQEQIDQERFARAAQAMCGDNAAWQLLPDGEVQCRTHRGHKTIVAEVAL